MSRNGREFVSGRRARSTTIQISLSHESKGEPKLGVELDPRWDPDKLAVQIPIPCHDMHGSTENPRPRSKLTVRYLRARPSGMQCLPNARETAIDTPARGTLMRQSQNAEGITRVKTGYPYLEWEGRPDTRVGARIKFGHGGCMLGHAVLNLVVGSPGDAFQLRRGVAEVFLGPASGGRGITDTVRRWAVPRYRRSV